MLKNRESAARSRKRKRDMMEQLEEEVHILRSQNRSLQYRLDLYVSKFGGIEQTQTQQQQQQQQQQAEEEQASLRREEREEEENQDGEQEDDSEEED